MAKTPLIGRGSAGKFYNLVRGAVTGTLVTEWTFGPTVAGYTYTSNAEATSVVISGATTTDNHGWVSNTTTGTYTITGANTTDLHGIVSNATVGSLTITGADTTDLHGWVSNTATTSMSVTGLDAASLYTPVAAGNVPHVNVGGTWYPGQMYIKVAGDWKLAEPKVNVSTVWH